MKQVMDKLKNKVKLHKRMFLFLAGIALIGFLFGVFFITILSGSDKTMVREYITNFMNMIDQNKMNYQATFFNTILSNGIFIGTIWLLGISIIGIPITLFLYFSKAFMLGFSIGAFILEYQFKGCLFAFLYVFPHHILNFLAHTLLMVYSIKFSLKLMDSIFHKKTINFKAIMNTYLIVLVIVAIILLISSLFEVFFVPFIFQKFAFLIK